MELMKEFDSDDQDEDGNPITKDDKDRRNYLRNNFNSFYLINIFYFFFHILQ